MKEAKLCNPVSGSGTALISVVVVVVAEVVVAVVVVAVAFVVCCKEYERGQTVQSS